MAKRIKKIFVLAIIFTMTVVNYGLPLQAIAAEGNSLFNFSFFRRNEIALNAYFDNDPEITEKTVNVNDTAKITLEVSPLIEGYLKSGTLELNLANGNENNFKIQSVTLEEMEEVELDDVDKTLLEEKEEVQEEPEKEDAENMLEMKELTGEKANLEADASISDMLQDASTSSITEDSEETTTEQSEEPEEPEESLNDMINEDMVEEPTALPSEELEEKEEIVEDPEELIKQCYEVSLAGENTIELKNIIDSTKIFVEIGYKQSEQINAVDLYNDIEITLNGNYINKKLETVEIYRNKALTMGWEYTKDIEVFSDFAKVSPFTVGDNFGTIIENIVTVRRNIEDNNFLPLKETNIKIEIPKINDKLPIAVNVSANKLMATLGKELKGTEFSKDNWTYDEETGILDIKVTNDELLVGKGEDKFDIICRYEDYIENEEITLNRNLAVRVEEVSSNENRIQDVEILEEQTIKVTPGELMSYTILENDNKINKGKINANYHTGLGYETEFSTIANLTVLTSDILEEVKIEPVKEIYIDAQGNELEAKNDVMYKGVKFNYAEIKEMLEKGSTIDLLDANDMVFHTITNENKACSISFSEKIEVVKIRINNVEVNGNITVEFVKAINNCKYSQIEFANIKEVGTTLKATVKYLGFEESFNLPEQSSSVEFTDSISQVNLSMNKSYLSAIAKNDNVEFKIDLLNNLETSDIYKNPTFELVFPAFIKEVQLNNVYTLYQNGLAIKDYQVFNENGLNKLRVSLEGVQAGFNFSNITNGTNIIINTNLVVDELAPQRKDEIQLYYCNEAVTNYQTQSAWSMSMDIPAGIIQATNGYDSTMFEYQAPSGLIAVNAITNYDGTGQTIKSIEQGEVIKTIAIKGESHIATMELTVVNNTGNECMDTVLLGRIPFKGNKDVETGADLGTNVDTIMKSALIADTVNSNSATIYYSTNPNADKDLDNELNNWGSTYTNFDNIKSYMIVVDGTIAPGGILKYKYDFEIPANLGYEVGLTGSFGAFYNSKEDNVIMYQTEIADRVGLITESGVKYEASMSVDIGDGAKIGEARYMKYIVKVKNTGSVDLENVAIVHTRPAFVKYCVKSETEAEGDNGYTVDNEKEKRFELGSLKAGEEVEQEILVKTNLRPENIAEYASSFENMAYEFDENGVEVFYLINENNEKEYITEVPENIFIESYATVHVNDTLNGLETNTVKNELVDNNFDIETTLFEHVDKITCDTNFKYVIDVYNISGKTLNNVVIEDVLPKELTYKGLDEYREEPFNSEFDEETNTLKVSFEKLEPLETAKIFINCNISKVKNEGPITLYNQAIVRADDDIEEKGTMLKTHVYVPKLVITQETNLEENTALETEVFEIMVNIDNQGDGDSQTIDFEVEIPEGLRIVDITSEGDRMITYTRSETKINANLYLLEAEKEGSLIIKAKSEPLAEGESNRIFEVNTKLQEKYFGDIPVEPLTVTIIDNPDRGMTEEEKKEEEDKVTVVNPSSGDEYKEDVENAKNENKQENQKQPENTQNNQGQKPVEKPAEETVQQIKTYKITGKVWNDQNKNNAKDSNEEGVDKVQVTLYEGDTKIKSTVTDSLGKYRFTEVPVGNYTVVFNYNGKEYKAAQYKLANVAESANSDAIESEEGIAVTDTISIRNSDIELNFGLQDRDEFDLSVAKYITKAIVTTKGKEKVEEYDSLDLAKLEIKSKELKNTTIKLEYKIVVSNIGNVDGTVETIKDYLPKALTFTESENSNWKLGTDGVLYNEALRNTVIKPGESKEIKLVLNKVMTEDNTGTISNKVEITGLSTDKSLKEKSDNNIATQEMIVTISTGRTISIAIFITAVILTTVLIYGIKTGKIKRIYR